MKHIHLHCAEFIVYSGVADLIKYDVNVDGKKIFTYILMVNYAYPCAIDKEVVMKDFLNTFDLYYKGERTYNDDSFVAVEMETARTLFKIVLDKEYGE